MCAYVMCTTLVPLLLCVGVGGIDVRKGAPIMMLMMMMTIVVV